MKHVILNMTGFLLSLNTFFSYNYDDVCDKDVVLFMLTTVKFENPVNTIQTTILYFKCN